MFTPRGGHKRAPTRIADNDEAIDAFINSIEKQLTAIEIQWSSINRIKFAGGPILKDPTTKGLDTLKSSINDLKQSVNETINQIKDLFSRAREEEITKIKEFHQFNQSADTLIKFIDNLATNVSAIDESKVTDKSSPGFEFIKVFENKKKELQKLTSDALKNFKALKPKLQSLKFDMDIQSPTSKTSSTDDKKEDMLSVVSENQKAPRESVTKLPSLISTLSQIQEDKLLSSTEPKQTEPTAETQPNPLPPLKRLATKRKSSIHTGAASRKSFSEKGHARQPSEAPTEKKTSTATHQDKAHARMPSVSQKGKPSKRSKTHKASAHKGQSIFSGQPKLPPVKTAHSSGPTKKRPFK